MQKKTYLRFGLLAVLLAASFIALRSANKVQEKAVCTENLDQCPKKRNNSTTPGNMIWETLSRQFVSFASSSY